MEEKTINRGWNTRTIAEIAIFAALGYVLDFVGGIYSRPWFPNGGSICIAMAAVFIMSYRNGLWAGVFTGLIMGLLDMADGFYVISNSKWYIAFIQVALDYWLAYPLAGLAGIVTKRLKSSSNKKEVILWASLGSLIGGLCKFGSHFLGGAIFWGSDSSGFAWSYKDSTINPWLYSFIYNIAYMGPSIIFSALIANLVIINVPKTITLSFHAGKQVKESMKKQSKERKA